MFSTTLDLGPQVRNARPVVSELTSLWAEEPFRGTTVSPAMADTWVGAYPGAQNVSKGSEAEICTKVHSLNPGSGNLSVWNEVGLIRFAGVNPAHCQDVPQVAVRLTVRYISKSPIVLAYGLVQNTSWDEAVTWNSRPSFSRALKRTQEVRTENANRQITLNITGWWTAGEALALWLQPDETVAANNNGHLKFFSREDGTQPGPELAISCTQSWANESWFGYTLSPAPTQPPISSTTSGSSSACTTLYASSQVLGGVLILFASRHAVLTTN